MTWATPHIEKLVNGEEVQFRPKGNSMQGKIESGQLVTVRPCDPEEVEVGSIVLCKVKGRPYLHLVKAIGSEGRFQIGNNKGHINGWTGPNQIYGLVISVED
jgi:SOS-response transcriptional repressor LexA